MSGKKRFVCKVCGYVSPKWEGRCPECGEWEALVERVEEKRTQKRTSLSAEFSQPRTVEEIRKDKEERFKTGIGEFDRMLGGGIVPGSVTLVGGEPGIGKSTFLLEVAQGLSSYRFPILYVSGEESLQQTGMRATRLGINSPLIYLIAENSLDSVETHVEKIRPRTLIVDSIQTVYLDEVDSSPGSVSQVRECTLFLVRMAKREQIAVFLVGHVTKDGSIAGPRIMEHMVDTVLYFESSRDYQYRILRATKNRFGPTSEIGIFKMGEKGLLEVQDASTLFISDTFLKDQSPGAAIVPTVEGSRVFLIEIQALVDRSNLAIPRRIAQGIDYNKLHLLLAVLGRHGFNFYQKDVYVNVAGGARVEEPACDLAIVCAIASSTRNIPLEPQTVFLGEIGLTGEIRPVGFVEQRLREARKLGFKRCIGSFLEKGEAKKIREIEFVGVRTLTEALREGFKK